MLRVISLNYTTDTAELFAKIAHLPGAAWLDSGRPTSEMGRYDIMTALPNRMLSPADKPAEMSAFEYIESVRVSLPEVGTHESPFTIGLLGYFSYEVNQAPTKKPKIVQAPEFAWGVYLQSLVLDHQAKSAKLFYWDDGDIQSAETLLSLFNKEDDSVGESCEPEFEVHEILSLTDRKTYELSFNKVLEHIHKGNTYQVNYTQAHIARYQGNTFRAYQALRERLPSPYSGYLNFEDVKILSFSPEQFIQKLGHQVFTKPIKGTRPRHYDPGIDDLNRKELEDSDKDKAENLMIVDLLRNDLGKHAIPATVHVEKLFELQSFANVHHLVSTISARLDQSTSGMQVLQDAWPGGSITGAPKKRAMSIIDKLEPHQRGVYCGCIGYLSANGNMDTNLCIRTIACDDKHMACWAGGGIVADSDVSLEYYESLNKIETLLEGLSHFQKSPHTERLVKRGNNEDSNG